MCVLCLNLLSEELCSPLDAPVRTYVDHHSNCTTCDSLNR